MACGNFSSATVFFKVAAVFIVLVCILHIAGFAVPRWSTLKLSADVFGFGFDLSYHTGLWKDCSCTSLLGTDTCFCLAKVSIPDWLIGVRALESFGLIGLLISVILSIIIIFSRQEKVVRGVNIVIVTCSGLFILIGLIIFGVENTKDFETLFGFIESLPLDLDTHGSLSAAFILCIIAGALCIVVCVPLLIKDYLTPIPPLPIQINPMPANQGLVVIPPTGQAHVVVNSSVQQPVGYMQPNTQGPQMHVPQVPPMQPSFAYPSQAQPQYGMQYSQQQGDFPYKS